MRLLVAGLGAMGSAIAMNAALRGADVVGVDRYERGHAHGASSGRSRIVRQGYFEDEAYVPLLLRAYELWHDLERRTQTRMMHLTGLLLVAPTESQVLARTLAAARRHDLRVESWSRDEILERYPTLRIRTDEIGVFEPQGGFIVPETAVAAFQSVAEDAGATLRFGVPMRSWTASASGVEVALGDGSIVRGDRLVLALGPWFAHELAAAGIPLRLQRNVQCWFSPLAGGYDAARFPAFLVDRPELPAPLYGFPDAGDGVKAALHGFGQDVDPERVDRTIAASDVAPVKTALEDFMPGAAGPLLEARACMYALTPDGHFVVGRHPEHERVVLCGGFSGHGFKFASVVGEIGADLALDGQTRHPVGFLSPTRAAVRA